MEPAAREAVIRFRERSELLDFLLEISAAMSQTLDLDQQLAHLAHIVKGVIPYDLFAVLLYNEKRQELRIRYAVGHRDEVVKGLYVGLGEGITGLAALQRDAILVNDVRNDPRYLNAMDAVRSELAVPMVARGKIVGVIDLQSTYAGAYTEYDRALLRLLAGRVAAVVDNARLYRRVERQNRTLKTLYGIAQEFSSILDLDQLLGKIASAVRSLISYDAFSILLLDEEQKLLRHRFSVRCDQRVAIDHVAVGLGITGAAAESREPIRVCDTAEDPRYIASHPDVRSEVAIPLISRDRVVGVMDLESDRVNYFTDEHVRTLSLLGPQIAISVENARLYQEVAERKQRMEEDLRAAREMQALLLPESAPEIGGLEIAVGRRPAREISGDIYDFFEHQNGHAVLAFGDVSGKGAAAALYGGLVSGLLRTLAPRRRGPADLMRELNEALIERKVEARYVTLLLMLWHQHSVSFTMANAGALPPMVCRQGEILKLRAEGVPLGLLDEREYEEVPFQAIQGDVIVLYSDGITDHTNQGGHEYGRARLAALVRAHCNQPAKRMVEALFQDLDRFNLEAFDDQTVMVVKVR